jgi:hypothetical protein
MQEIERLRMGVAVAMRRTWASRRRTLGRLQTSHSKEDSTGPAASNTEI